MDDLKKLIKRVELLEEIVKEQLKVNKEFIRAIKAIRIKIYNG